MPNPVVHFEVLGKDAEALQAFYGQVFDWQLNAVMPTYAMVSTGVEGGPSAASAPRARHRRRAGSCAAPGASPTRCRR